MAQAPHPRMHGLTHLLGGSDPIPGLVLPAGGGSYRDTVLAEPSLWGFWPMDDPSGNFHNEANPSFPLVATAHASFPFGYQTPGPFTGSGELSASFDGTDSAVVVTVGRWAAVTANIFGTNNAFTAEAWIYPTSATYGYPLAHGGATSDPQWGIQYGYSPETDQILTAARGGLGGASSGFVATVNTWTHVALTHDGATTRLYANGALIYSFASAATATTQTGFYVGRNAASLNPGTTARYFTGQISLVALYTAALDAADVAAHAGAPGIAAATAGQVVTSDGAGGTSWAYPTTQVAGARYDEILAGTGITATDNADGTVTLSAAAGGASAGDTLAWMPLTTTVGGDDVLVYDAGHSLIPTLVPI